MRKSLLILLLVLISSVAFGAEPPPAGIKGL
jgi:hypothetical protein